MKDDEVAEELRELRSEIAELRRQVERLDDGGASEPAGGRDEPVGASDERVGPARRGDSSPGGDGSDASDGADARTAAPTEPETATVDERPGPERERGDEPANATGRADAESAHRTPEDDGEHPGASGFDWERSLGTKWLGIVGAFAMVLAVVFLARVAIDRGLIGPLGRVGLGTIGGLALVALGRYAGSRRGYERWGTIAAGGGLAVAYFSVYAAYGIGSYRTALGTPLWAVLLGLTALIAGAVALSVRDDEPLVAGEAFLLGFVTAIVALEASTPLATPAYVVLLTAGLLAVSTERGWDGYPVVGVFGSYGALVTWLATTAPATAIEVGAGVATFGLYLAASYALAGRQRDDPERSALRVGRVLLTAANAGFAAVLLEATVPGLVGTLDLSGVGTGVVAAALLGSYAATDERPVVRDDAAGALAVLLAVPAVALAFGTFGTTIGLLGVLLGVAALGRRLEGTALRTAGHLAAVATLGQVLVYATTELPAFDAGDPVTSLTGRAVALGAVAAAFYALAWWWHRTRPDHLFGIERDATLAGPYSWVGSGLTALLVTLELSGLWITVGWAVLGLALVGAGLRRSVRTLRLQGIAVLLVATLKVFVLDTAGLGLLARTLSFLVLGAILLATSYAYARWQSEESEPGLGEE